MKTNKKSNQDLKENTKNSIFEKFKDLNSFMKLKIRRRNYSNVRSRIKQYNPDYESEQRLMSSKIRDRLNFSQISNKAMTYDFYRKQNTK